MEINWEYLAGMSGNNGRTFHRLYKSVINGIEVRKEVNSKSSWYYLKDEPETYKDYNQFLNRLNVRLGNVG